MEKLVMHVLHIYAVEAETKHDAIRAVENFANNETWSDWNQVGGRWDDELPDDCVAFSENEDLCRATIVKMKKRTEDVVGEVIREYGNITIMDLLSDIEKYTLSGPAADDKDLDQMLASFRIAKALDVVRGETGSDQFYYDITDFSEDPQWFFGRAETKPNQQFLVAVDLHF